MFPLMFALGGVGFFGTILAISLAPSEDPHVSPRRAFIPVRAGFFYIRVTHHLPYRSVKRIAIRQCGNQTSVCRADSSSRCRRRG
jgi:hypothetical protein